MTGAEWLACTDPEPMLAFLRSVQSRRRRFLGWLTRPPYQASDRKLRLFACAYCRLEWHLLVDERSRTAVAVAERYADGLATEGERGRAADGASAAASGLSRPTLEAETADAAWHAVFSPASAAAAATCHGWLTYRRIDKPHPALLRCIFGPLPFRPVAIDPRWLTWNHGMVPAVARRIYEERAVHDLPILADALEDAGCTDQDILKHCRSDGPHARGCWVVDLVLGKG
jgi:hypothetical protein